MEKPLNLTIFYTHGLGGDLHLLPRLYTYLETLKAQLGVEKPLLLDLGGACAAGVWHCDVTGGRSMLVALDGLGYHAANVERRLAPPQREKIEPVVQMGLVDSGHPWTYHVPPVEDESIQVMTHPQDDPSLRLTITLYPAESTHIDGKALHLATVEKGQVGMARVDLDGEPLLATQAVYTLPDGLKPNPTIVAAVDFVESEARYFEKKQRGDGG